MAVSWRREGYLTGIFKYVRHLSTLEAREKFRASLFLKVLKMKLKNLKKQLTAAALNHNITLYEQTRLEIFKKIFKRKKKGKSFKAYHVV